MANIGSVLQTVGKGLKKVTNSKAGRIVGKSVNTIFTPVKKAHQAQGLRTLKGFFYENYNGISEGYALGLLGTVFAAGGSVLGALFTDINANKNFDKDFDKYEKKRLISSKLLDTTVGVGTGFVLGGPIGAAVLGAAALVIPKDILLGNEGMWSEGDKIHTYNDVRSARKAARKAEQEEQKNKEIQENKEKWQEMLAEYHPSKLGLSIDSDSTQVADSTQVNSNDSILSDSNAVLAPDSTLVAETTLLIKPESVLADSNIDVVDDRALVADADLVDKPDATLANTDVNDSELLAQNDKEIPKTDNNTSFWRGELNDIEKESIKIDKGDCLWNIAKRELQKVNQGRTITNVQIVKQIKEFGRLNPELFGENPSYESLDYIQAGVILKLSA